MTNDWPPKGTVIQFVPRKGAQLERSDEAAEVLRRAIARGYMLSVGPRDGEWEVVRMRDYLRVVEALMTAKGDARVTVRSSDGTFLGDMAITGHKVISTNGEAVTDLVEGNP